MMIDANSEAATMYLDLLKRCLLRSDFGEEHRPLRPAGTWKRFAASVASAALRRGGLELVRHDPPDPELRREGREWPPPRDAETMIGLRRLDNLQDCITDVLSRGVPGDLLETGVWRGGATIFMRGVLKAYGVTDRRVWVADSFKGLPRPNAAVYPADRGDEHWTFSELAVSRDEVARNFERYGLLDDQVEFLEGWFKDTLGSAPIERLSILRLDGDMYESTMDALLPLYGKVEVGGYVIVDDYGVVPGCRAAVDDFRAERDVTDPIVDVDGTGVFWRKSQP